MSAIGAARYRFRATLGRRWRGYLALALLIGVVGGMALGSMTAARRTYASYPRFLASTNPSDLVVQPFTTPAYSPGFVRQLAGLPHVNGVGVAVPFSAVTLTPGGGLRTVLLAHVQLAASLASPHGLYSDQDRVTVIRGRRADPARADEVVASPDAAALLRLQVGSHLRVGLVSSSQQGTTIPAGRRADLTVVGIGVFNTQVLQDGIDSGRTGSLLGTPALARKFASCCASGMTIRAVLAAVLPASGVEGLRFALDPGRGRTAVPTRSVMAGAILAIAVVSATLTFGASLSTLVSHPDLYGWNFSYAFYGVQGWGPVPAKLADPLLARDHLVAATTGVSFPTVQVDGQTVPAMVAPARPAVGPHVLSGHGLAGSRQVVLGPATLAQLHKRVGDTVTVASGTFHVRLRIAGTATMPTIGGVLSVHPSMATGVLFSRAVLPGGAPAFGTLSGPNAILVRLRSGVSPAAGLRSLQAISRRLAGVMHSPRVVAASHGASIADTIDLLPAQRPAEIVNYKSMGAMPTVLAGGLATGAVAALGLTLVASVRRRRRDFALLKTLGFTRGQLAAAVAWQSTTIAVVGLAIGLPLGIAAGRWLWLLFARELSAVPVARIPAVPVVLAAAAALILANLVAALPGQAAARTRAALVLRSE